MDAAQNATRYAAGLSRFEITVDGYNYAYLDTGKNDDQPTIVMVHGFNADKDNWPRMAFFLKDKYRLIAVDLLGHGESDQARDASYRISAQTARLQKVLSAIGVEQYHLIGNSMGGQISGAFAARYPENVLSATLLNNGGIISPQPSEFWQLLQAGKPNPLVPTDPSKADDFFNFVFANPPYIPQSIKAHYIEKGKTRKEMSNIIFEGLKGDNFENLALELPNIKAPIQIVWGKEDRVIDVSSIEVMTPLLEDETVVVLDNVGHAPMMEVPETVANLLDTFISNL
jgi:pimeloyl-ACP methyl ester carboxylesterase